MANAREGKAPAYQWYPGDALADEAMSTMTLEEEGAFRRLLDHHYRERSIPADKEELRRLCKWITPRRFEAIWKRVGKCFAPHPSDPSRLVNARAAEQRKTLDDFVESSAAGGVAAAANMTAEQRSERARNAAKARHSAANEQADTKQDSAKALLSAANTASASASASAKKDVTLTLFQGDDMNRVCTYCGVQQSQVDWAFEADHFIPKSAGGTDDPSNIVPCCHVCNQIKQGRIFKTIDDARRHIHSTLWTKNRQRYIEPRKICFGGKPPDGWQSTDHRSVAAQVLDVLNEHRARLRIGSGEPLRASDGNLAEIVKRLRDGATFAECRHVIRAAAHEVQQGGDEKWFNPATLFRASTWPLRVAAYAPPEPRTMTPEQLAAAEDAEAEAARRKLAALGVTC